MIQDLRKIMEAKIEKMQEMFTKDLELNNKHTEMNNSVEGVHSRITEEEAQISDLEDRMVEITATEQNIERRRKRNEDSLRDLWDSIKYMIIRIIWAPEGEEREKGAEKIFKDIIAGDFLNMGKGIINQVQEVLRVPGRINPRRNTLKHIVIELTKIKDRDKILKATRGK